MATIENFVNLPSKADWEEILEKFPAFASADLSEKAKKEGAHRNSDYKTGWYFTRTVWPGWLTPALWIMTLDGGLSHRLSYDDDAGLRVALQTIYNPDNSLVKGCKESTSCHIW